MTEIDHLDRQPFIDLIKSIVETQSKNTSGYSIAINGKWGCGKTFVLKMLEEQLRENTLLFHYNAWENDFYDEPLIAILSVLIEALNKITSQKTIYNATVNKLIKTTLKALRILTSTVVEHFTKLDLNELIKDSKNFPKEIKDDTKISNEINKLLPLEKTINSVRENLEKLSKEIAIVIVVDELDRCLPEYAIKILERLHHICNESNIVQIIAIDKEQLAGSLAKVFGREIFLKNPISVLEFADLYLQKFIDITIPLTAGTLDNKLAILNGLEKNYEPYIRNDMVGNELVKLDDDFLLNFITSIMRGIDRRTQEKIFKQVELCHKLTVDSGAHLEYCSYAILIYEILSCIKLYIFHSTLNHKLKYGQDNMCHLSFAYNYSNSEFLNDKNYLLVKNINNFFTFQIKEIEHHPDNNENINNFRITDTKTYLLRYFISTNIKFLCPLQNGFLEWIAEDKEFLSKYDTIMQTLTT